MATNTYVALDKITVGTAVSSVTFSSIPATYTDLVLVMVGNISDGSNMGLRFNSDSATNYSNTVVYGTGSAAASTRSTSTNGLALAGFAATGLAPSNAITQIINYANTTTYKTVLQRGNNLNGLVRADVGLWRSTSAITSIYVYVYGGANLDAGMTLTLYGIASTTAQGAKAEGGIITSDSAYWYHTFTASGTFTPLQSLSCDYLVVAGGGGGGVYAGGGGGAGGYRTSTGFSVTATPYSITVGSGGAGYSGATGNGTVGNSSIFSTITSAGGGYGGGQAAGGAGGSGGGGAGIGVLAGGAASPSGQGNAGGAGGATTGGAGGGGASAVGSAGAASYKGGAGGDGSSSSINGTAITYAGGGGGASDATVGGVGGAGGGGAGGFATGGAGTSGTVNTGGGGGGAWVNATAGSGGSGIVIIRYAK